MRPKITCHMSTSLDGRLHPSRWSAAKDGSMKELADRLYETIGSRFDADGWIVGRRTMAEIADEGERPDLLDEPKDREPHIVERNGGQLAIAIDPSGRLLFESGELGGEQVVVVLSTRVPDAVLKSHREKSVAYVFAGPDGHDLKTALETIGERFAVSHLLLEGGGTINGAFLASGLIDHVSTLIAPAIDGLKGVDAIYDHAGEANERPAQTLCLTLSSCETLEGGVVWLRHDVSPAPETGSRG
ncbi:5-amino-6-(5-phosphoribosylamino)uracil reductase [Fulvimarina endophytica]|uniref:5-amino-6-(5-phosphoribosylamino)uracil reductase n=1 Tax=Fulvimarina endophytica TaxID=2293836 RepID=A0A371X2P3_9HYPH|nr:RibD family protein [Fulvimarina endophytica]RFC63497.1 5-amino-6-(5-phosphoribosylamino)uracil reductase [Fulvimarina endophytica]